MMSNARIKIVLKYILALAVPPALCALMMPLFTALLLRTGLADIGYPTYVFLVHRIVDAIAVAVSGLIMGLLISSLARNREIMMTLFGVLMVAIIYVGSHVYFFSSIDSNSTAESFDNMRMAKYGILLLGLLLVFALIGAWLVLKKRRLRAQKQ